MKEKIHPKWYPDAKIICAACNTEWHIPGTVAIMRVDICSNCHPFYTGEQRIVDTEGQVDRFMKRLQVRDTREAARREKEEKRQNAEIPLSELGLGERYIKILNEAGLHLVSDVLSRLQTEGDNGILNIPGIGVKVLTDAKRKISELGFPLPNK
jgi:large subunit ribosomal protein L31